MILGALTKPEFKLEIAPKEICSQIHVNQIDLADKSVFSINLQSMFYSSSVVFFRIVPEICMLGDESCVTLFQYLILKMATYLMKGNILHFIQTLRG